MLPSKILPMEVKYNMARKVQFVETVLRDANQSLIATRLPFEKFEPMLETIDKAGFYAAECCSFSFSHSWTVPRVLTDW